MRQIKYRKKKNNLLKALMGITVGCGIMTGILSMTFLMMNISIKHKQKELQKITSTAETVENKLNTAKQQEKEYEGEVEMLQQELMQYQPVVIPDSMKK